MATTLNNDESPEYFIDQLNKYEPTIEFSNELHKLSTILNGCDESFIQKFINLFGCIKLMHVLDMVKRLNSSQIDLSFKSDQLITILTILNKIVSTKYGHEYIQKSYEMEPEESNLLRTFVSYLNLDNENENAILLNLINSLNESKNFANHCYHQLKQPRPDTNNGFELILKLLENSKIELINSICVLIKKIVSSLPTDSNTYKDLITDLHDIGINDKLEIIGNNNANEKVNLPLELYEDLSTRYGKLEI